MIKEIKERLIKERDYFNPAHNDFQHGRAYQAGRTLDFIDELEQKLNLSGIGSKWPTTQGIRSVGTRYMNKSKWGNLLPLDIREAFISGAEWALSQAACDTAKGRSAEETAPAPKAD